MASIQKRPNGKWRARYRDDEGREHSRHFERKVDATRYLETVAVSLRTGSYVDPVQGRTTLASFYISWSARQVWAASTRRASDHALAGCTFADVELGKLRRSHVETWVKSMDLAPSTIATRMKYVRGVLRGAVRDRLLASDPSGGVVLPRRRRAEHAMVVPTLEEVSAILAASEDWMRPWVELMAFAGLRIGEASAAQVGDIDFLKGRRLHVQRQIQNHDGERLVLPPKHGSERHVVLPDQLLNSLARHIETAGVRGGQGWLFNGAPPSPNALRRRFEKTCVRAGVTGISPHDLRHFYASSLIDAGCDVVTVQKALGHSKASTTLDIYAHLMPQAADRTRKAAAAAMAAAAPADYLRTAQSLK